MISSLVLISLKVRMEIAQLWGGWRLGDWVAIYMGELYFVQLDYRNIECSLKKKKMQHNIH